MDLARPNKNLQFITWSCGETFPSPSTSVNRYYEQRENSMPILCLWLLRPVRRQSVCSRLRVCLWITSYIKCLLVFEIYLCFLVCVCLLVFFLSFISLCLFVRLYVPVSVFLSLHACLSSFSSSLLYVCPSFTKYQTLTSAASLLVIFRSQNVNN